MLKRLSVSIIGLVVLVLQALTAPAMAQDDKLSKPELDQILAPIALYPDDLLTNVLMASTYPLDVVQAARWVKEPGNAKLKGDALTKALESKDWDPSVKALVQFPSVLETMSEKLDWTQKLGDAFLAQQDEVMDQIQFLRQKAADAGNLKSNKQQKVTTETGAGGNPVYVIEPADPDVVYVPTYQPTVVYGPWWYDDYPPYYWGYPGSSYVDGWWWGSGVAIAAGIWGWNHCDWRRHDIDIDVNKWNTINGDRNKITNAKWEHRPDRRGPVPYGNKELRDKFAKGERQPGSKDFRGFDRDNIDRAQIESRLKGTDHSGVKDKMGGKAGDNLKGKTAGGGAELKNKAGNREGPNVQNKAAIQNKAANAKGKAANIPNKAANVKGKGERTKAANVNQPKPQRSSPGAFDVKRGADVRQAANRGHASRMASGGGQRSFASGGGGGRGGGGGGRRR